MKVMELHIRTLAAILIWLVAALLILNVMFKSGWILLISVILMITAIVIYFLPRLKKQQNQKAKLF